MNLGAGLLAVCTLAACAPQPAAPLEPLRLLISATECALGQPLLLTVHREWEAGEQPAPWDPATLQPLALELVDKEQSASGARMREVLRYRTVAFAAGELAFPPHFSLRVHSGLPPGDAGEPELPSAQSADGNRAWLALLLLPMLAFGLARARRRGMPAAAIAPPPLGVTHRLRRLDPHSAQFSAELAAALRDWLAERAALRAPGRHAEELLANDERLPPTARDQLRGIVRRCEENRFAGVPWDTESRHAALAAALDLVEEQS